MSENGEQQTKWHYFVTFSGMSGVTISNPDEIAKYRTMAGWREVSQKEFDRTLTSASYYNADMGYGDYD